MEKWTCSKPPTRLYGITTELNGGFHDKPCLITRGNNTFSTPMLVFWKARIVMSVQPPKPGIFLYTQLTLASTDTEIEVPPVLIHLNEIFHYKPSIFGATILGKPHVDHSRLDQIHGVANGTSSTDDVPAAATLMANWKNRFWSEKSFIFKWQIHIFTMCHQGIPRMDDLFSPRVCFDPVFTWVPTTGSHGQSRHQRSGPGREKAQSIRSPNQGLWGEATGSNVNLSSVIHL